MSIKHSTPAQGQATQQNQEQPIEFEANIVAHGSDMAAYRKAAEMFRDASPEGQGTTGIGCRVEIRRPDGGYETCSDCPMELSPSGEARFMISGKVPLADIARLDRTLELQTGRQVHVPAFNRGVDVSIHNPWSAEVNLIANRTVEVVYRNQNEPDRPAYYQTVVGAFEEVDTTSHSELKLLKHGSSNTLVLKQSRDEIVEINRLGTPQEWDFRDNATDAIPGQFPVGTQVELRLKAQKGEDKFNLQVRSGVVVAHTTENTGSVIVLRSGDNKLQGYYTNDEVFDIKSKVPPTGENPFKLGKVFSRNGS